MLGKAARTFSPCTYDKRETSECIHLWGGPTIDRHMFSGISSPISDVGPASSQTDNINYATCKICGNKMVIMTSKQNDWAKYCVLNYGHTSPWGTVGYLSTDGAEYGRYCLYCTKFCLWILRSPWLGRRHWYYRRAFKHVCFDYGRGYSIGKKLPVTILRSGRSRRGT